MSGKRRATSDLNHDNWDQEEDSEEVGAFSVAPKEVMEKRVIRTAKRRSAAITGDKPNQSIFSGFGGFNQKQSTIPNSFDFLANVTNGKADTPKFNGATANKPFADIKSNETSSLLSPSSSLGSLGKTNVIKSDTEKAQKIESVSNANTSANSEEYFSKLRGLNESVSNWIKSHVEENPLCILTPIFQDYEKYLKEIQNSLKHSKEKNFKDHNISIAATEKSFSKSGNADVFESGYFKKATTSSPSTTNTSVFSSTVCTTSSTQGILSFAKNKSLNSEEKPFSFGNGKPFSFANVDQSKSTESPKEEEEQNENNDEDEPPKVEFTPVVEEDSVYDKRCKIFVKKDGNFGDRGVGNLFIKPVENSEKYQLIVRANTSLGNLLVNILLTESIPKQRMGKNNVMLVCIPTPDSKPPPVPILVRVKTSDEADELLTTLQQYSK